MASTRSDKARAARIKAWMAGSDAGDRARAAGKSPIEVDRAQRKAMKAATKASGALKGRSASGAPSKTTARSPRYPLAAGRRNSPGAQRQPTRAQFKGNTMAAKKKSSKIAPIPRISVKPDMRAGNPRGKLNKPDTKAGGVKKGAKPLSFSKRVGFVKAKPLPSKQGAMKRLGIKFQGATIRNVQKKIGGVTGRGAQSRGTARPKGATTGPMTAMGNQQARIKREMARGNMAMRKKDGTARATSGVRKIQGAQRKVENAFAQRLKAATANIAKATKRGNTAGVAMATRLRASIRGEYKSFVKGGRKVGSGG